MTFAAAAQPRLEAAFAEVELGATSSELFAIERSSNPHECHVAWIEKSGPDTVLVHDGRQLARIPGFGQGSLRLSSDGRRVAVIAHDGAKLWVLVDGIAGPKYSDIMKPGVIFSPDGK